MGGRCGCLGEAKRKGRGERREGCVGQGIAGKARSYNSEKRPWETENSWGAAGMDDKTPRGGARRQGRYSVAGRVYFITTNVLRRLPAR